MPRMELSGERLMTLMLTYLFSITTWDLVQDHRYEVIWSRLVWFTQGVLRFTFITWIFLRDRLPTGHRTTQWSHPEWGHPQGYGFVLLGTCLVLIRTWTLQFHGFSQALMIDSLSFFRDLLCKSPSTIYGASEIK